MTPTQQTPLPLREVVKPTHLFESDRLNQALGVQLTIASETGQHTGSFKFRAAYNVASTVPNDLIITASSGNFGQALAYACKLLGKACIVVMPTTSAKIKMAAVRHHGGRVELVDTTVKSRAERVAELAAEHPEAYVASSYDDRLVIAGNASLGVELATCGRAFDRVIVPVGGGGLSAGVVTGLRQAGSHVPVIGAEPLLANDAARSLRAGEIVVNPGEPQTIADGARTVSLGRHNWEVLREGLRDLVEVPEERIKEAVRLYARLADHRVEPTGALTLGAVLTRPEEFRGLRVCCIVSGGNVDADVYDRLMAEA
ncbi:MAG TPA: threonine/serine dehydratase [Stenomitos sp.]